MAFPLYPTRTWPARSHRLSRSICHGKEDCQYEPKVRERRSQVATAGCDIAWRVYSEAIFNAFQEVNPELQYKNHHSCILEAQARNHRCPGDNCKTVRGRPLDHDELVRFPDNEKLIISHPYQDGTNYNDELEAWRQRIPNLEMLVMESERSWYLPRVSSLGIVGQVHILNLYQGGMCNSEVLKTTNRTPHHLISPIGPNWVATDSAV